MKKSHKYIYRILVICFAGIILFLTFNRHSKSGYFNYHSEIWADKAGYYVYLPAAFKFKFNPDNFPESIDNKTGHGFKLDYENKKVLTKYTYGVALLQLPFFLIADTLAESLNFKANGFSPVYHWSINVASIFYLILGLFFLGKFLKIHFKSNIICLVLLSIFLATNLYYYSIDETGMSHVYSFSLFCLYLYLLQRTNYLLIQNFWKIVLFGIVCGLIILIRPSNVIFLSAYFFLDINSKSDVFLRLKRLLLPKIFLPIIFSAFIIILPQLLYWKYAHGSLITYTYGNEGFNWTDPKLLQTWFSPNNGLFLYSPFYFVIIASLIYMIRKGIKNGVFILVLFLAISYVFSSWWDWGFGCCYGARNYVEYLAIFSIPLAYLYKNINRLNTGKIIGFWLLIFILIIFNLKMIYSYDVCFYGAGNWDWDAFFKLVVSPTK